MAKDGIRWMDGGRRTYHSIVKVDQPWLLVGEIYKLSPSSAPSFMAAERLRQFASAAAAAAVSIARPNYFDTSKRGITYY